jgi:hypothetical protein
VSTISTGASTLADRSCVRRSQASLAAHRSAFPHIAAAEPSALYNSNLLWLWLLNATNPQLVH